METGGERERGGGGDGERERGGGGERERDVGVETGERQKGFEIIFTGAYFYKVQKYEYTRVFV